MVSGLPPRTLSPKIIWVIISAREGLPMSVLGDIPGFKNFRKILAQEELLLRSTNEQVCLWVMQRSCGENHGQKKARYSRDLRETDQLGIEKIYSCMDI